MIVSQTELKYISNTSTLYILPWLIVATIGILMLLCEEEETIRKILITALPVIAFTIVAVFAHRDSMYCSTGKYEYQVQVTTVAPEIDISKYKILKKNIPASLIVEMQDNLTKEEEKALKEVEPFSIKVAFYRGVCVVMWLFILKELIENLPIDIFAFLYFANRIKYRGRLGAILKSVVSTTIIGTFSALVVCIGIGILLLLTVFNFYPVPL